MEYDKKYFVDIYSEMPTHKLLRLRKEELSELAREVLTHTIGERPDIIDTDTAMRLELNQMELNAFQLRKYSELKSEFEIYKNSIKSKKTSIAKILIVIADIALLFFIFYMFIDTYKNDYDTTASILLGLLCPFILFNIMYVCDSPTLRNKYYNFWPFIVLKRKTIEERKKISALSEIE